MKIEMNDVEYITETAVTIRETRRRTTLPKVIVDKLEIKDKDRIRWILFKDGTILLQKVSND
ncbi:MAG: AbrB/MazE/SpoVT family DNA-binding domain-containing protein [Candidatus Helarchaeota archaeon]